MPVEALLLLIGLIGVLVSFLISTGLVLYVHGRDTSAQGLVLRRRGEAWDVTWRVAVWRWRQGRRIGAILRLGWRIWQTFRDYKRTTVLGFLDLALLQTVGMIVAAAVGVGFWDVVLEVIRWLQTETP